MKRFIQGILFILIIYPLTTDIMSIFAQLTEHLCMKIAIKTHELKKALGEEAEEISTQAIGFVAPSVVDEEEDYYEGEEEE